MTDDPYRPPTSPQRVQKPKWSYAFRDLSGLTATLRVLLWLGVVAGVVSAISNLMQVQLMSDTMAGRTITVAEADSNDARQGMVAVTFGILFLVTALVFLRWLYRTSSNAHALATQKMRFTPGWAQAWYFIPIWSLWMPYQVMKEIWQVSQEGARYQKPVGQVVVWWVLFLAARLVSTVVDRLMAGAASPAELHGATLGAVLANALHVASCIVTVAMVGSIHRMQQENLERRKAAAG